MKGSEESKVKPKVWMVEEGTSVRFDAIVIEEKDSISRKDLLKYVRAALEEYEKHLHRCFQQPSTLNCSQHQVPSQKALEQV